MTDKELKEIFPYEYVSGGYFRRTGKKKGEKAEMLHGMEAIKYVINKLKGDKDEKV